MFDAASVVACSWLLWKVGSKTGGRLLPVQLVNLALADLLYSTAQAWTICVVLGGGSGYSLMMGCLVLSETAFLTALCMDVHIAAGFLALYWRLPRVMHVLKRTTYFTWLVSLLWVLVWTSFLPSRSNSVSRWTLAVQGCIAIVLYVMAWLKSSCFPSREELRARRIVWLYLLTFVFTTVPYIIFPVGARYGAIAGATLALNGVLNVLIYHCNSRFSGTVWSDVTDDTGSPMIEWARPSSRPVGFSVRSPEVVTVPAVQREALQESDREIAELEAAQTVAAEEG